MADLSPHPGTDDDIGVGPDRGSTTSTPLWVKVFGIIALVVVLLFVILLFTRGPGGHGPGRHAPSGGHPPPAIRTVAVATLDTMNLEPRRTAVV